jgi:hypothetical protein
MTELHKHLSEAERAFLRQLFREAAPVDAQPDADCLLEFDPASAESRLLLTLLSRMDTVVLAEDARYQLRFELNVVAAPFGGPARLRLSAPLVLDRQGVERAARVTPPGGEIEVRDPSGALQPLAVENISHTGISLMVQQPARPGTELPQLELALPGRAPFTIAGRVVRVQRHQDPAVHRLAVAFEHLEPAAQEALKRYIFDRYTTD